jgi:two-component system sensor histidine kinase ChiS
MPIKSIISILAVLACLIFPALITCSHDSTLKKKPVSVRGVLDLRDWNFTKDGPLNLDGEWEFYWDRLIEPSDFTKRADRKDCGFISVPGLWESCKVHGADLPGNGYATYRLKIISGPDKKMKFLSIHRIFSAYTLWINGVLADKREEADKSPKTREDYIFIHSKRISSFTLHEGENVIVLHVLNNENKSGGIDRPLRLEDGHAASQRAFWKHTIGILVVGMLLFASIYNIIFYFFRKNEEAPLYFGIFCLVWAVNIYNLQIPVLSGSLSYHANPFLLDFITAIVSLPLCVMTIKSLYPDDFSMTGVRLAQALSVGCIIPLLFVEFKTADLIFRIYVILVFFFVLYFVYVTVRTVVKRRDDAILFLIGFTALYVCGVNDLLYSMWIIDTANITQYGMLVLCISTSTVISRRFSRALWTIGELSRDLAEKNIYLSKMDRLKDQFLANTSHELRTPLHGMIGLAESMIEGDAGSLTPKVRENLSLIASSGHRLANMVNDLLDMAKIQDKGLNLNLRPVDIYSLSEMVVNLSLPLVGGKPLEIINNIKPDISCVCADEDRIRQVLYNLIGNAVKFTNKGTIELSARLVFQADEDRDAGIATAVEVSVADTGIGVPDECKEEIFEAYGQVDGNNTRPYPGTGLGLAIVKQIIELHNGTIGVASGKNGGSVFFFTLPIAKEPLADTSDENFIESMSDGLSEDTIPNRPGSFSEISEGSFSGNPVFLVVDDDPVNIRILRNYFESKRCIVKTAADGISALDILDRDDSIDLVLLDIMMPVVSGCDVCRRIRLKRPPEELPVIMLTAKNMISDIDDAFEAGANDYVVKPFRLNELMARVSTMLKLRNICKSAATGITIRGRNRAYSLTFRDIIYITSSSKNIIVHTREGDIEALLLMKEIADRLPPDIFVRIHKSYIININYIYSISHVLSGRYRVRLRDDDDTELPIGAAFLESLRKKISL